MWPGTRNVLQASGSDGFVITYWRRVFGDGTILRDERFTARYKPEDQIVEVGPKPPPRPPTTTGQTSTTGGTGTTDGTRLEGGTTTTEEPTTTG